MKKLEACAYMVAILEGAISLRVLHGQWSVEVFTRSGRIAGSSGASLGEAVDGLFDALSKKASEMQRIASRFVEATRP